MEVLRQHKLTRVEVHPVLGSWGLCAHKRRAAPRRLWLCPKGMAKPDTESDPCAVHPFGALGGNGSRGGGSPCTRWLADYRYRCRLM